METAREAGGEPKENRVIKDKGGVSRRAEKISKQNLARCGGVIPALWEAKTGGS